MIKIKNIRKIPKVMLKKIEKLDKEYYPKPDGHKRFYKYYTLFNRELCEVIVAVRHYYKRWYCKQVVVHGIHTDKVFLRDIALIAGFYAIGWYRDGISKYEHWYDYDWGYNDEKYFNLYAPIVNKDFILTLPEYKYSAVNLYPHNDVLQYLKAFEQYPQAELLVKANLGEYATSKMILRQCAKDKQFCKWLYQNRDEVKHSGYISSIIRAYKQKRSVREMYTYDNFKKSFDRPDNFKRLKEMFTGAERKKFLEYLIKQKTDGYCYQDYLSACEYLQLDMTLPKNRYPHDFQRWHDIRTDQYHTQKAIDDKKAKKELYERFSKVANKYLSLERFKLKDDYVCLIAKSPAQLIHEGKELNHCVGRMNYDQKFAREESLIFFIRNRLSPNTPYVTLEYSPTKHKVLQCYAESDSKPTDEVLNFVNKVWLPFANRQLKKLTA